MTKRLHSYAKLKHKLYYLRGWNSKTLPLASHIDLIRFHLLQAAIQSHKSLIQLKLQSCQATLLFCEAEAIHVWHYMQMYLLATSNIKSRQTGRFVKCFVKTHAMQNMHFFHPGSSITHCMFVLAAPIVLAVLKFTGLQDCNCLYYKIIQ